MSRCYICGKERPGAKVRIGIKVRRVCRACYNRLRGRHVDVDMRGVFGHG